VVSEEAQMGIELNELKDYILDLHKESFEQVVRQAVFLYDVLEQNDMDPDKDVFNGRLMSIKEIPTAPDESAAADKGDNDLVEGKEAEGDDGMRGEEYLTYVIFSFVNDFLYSCHRQLFFDSWLYG